MTKSNARGAPTQADEFTLPFHPIANVFPLMTGTEFDELVADIKAHGLNEPIVTFQDKILDGRNRARACAEAGVKPRYHLFASNEADARAHVISANIRRRHLDPAAKRKFLKKVIAWTPETSDRQLGKQLGVDHKTIAKARKEGESTGDVSPVGKRTGRDGRTRRQPIKKKKAADKSTGALVWKHNTTTRKSEAKTSDGFYEAGKIGPYHSGDNPYETFFTPKNKPAVHLADSASLKAAKDLAQAHHEWGEPAPAPAPAPAAAPGSFERWQAQAAAAAEATAPVTTDAPASVTAEPAAGEKPTYRELELKIVGLESEIEDLKKAPPGNVSLIDAVKAVIDSDASEWGPLADIRPRIIKDMKPLLADLRKFAAPAQSSTEAPPSNLNGKWQITPKKYVNG
jgi:ParB-like chromosome segregation protein Spo0J